MLSRKSWGALPSLLLLAMSRFSNAACECGYSINKTSDTSHAVFTELLENDFLHTSTEDFNKIGWQAQVYNVSSKNARGPFGKSMDMENIVTNPLKDSKAWAGDAEHGGDAGVELWVRGDHGDGFVSSSELVTMRNDSLYGSFRVGMKLSNSSGTCGAFFFVRSLESLMQSPANNPSTTTTRRKSTSNSSPTNLTNRKEQSTSSYKHPNPSYTATMPPAPRSSRPSTYPSDRTRSFTSTASIGPQTAFPFTSMANFSTK
jgi:hypothetical protein